MPKPIARSKTKKAVAKRFKITGTGKILRSKASRRHLLSSKSAKRKRQYEHIKESEQARGSSRAEEIAARTVNKQRAQAGETKSSRGGRKTSGAKKASRSSSRSTRSSSSSRGRKSASKKR